MPSYTLTATNSTPDYGDLEVSRTASPYARAPIATLLTAPGTATVYYGDALSGASTPAKSKVEDWSEWETITPPAVSSTGAALNGNLSITNRDGETRNMYYNTVESTEGGISIGAAQSNATARTESQSISFGGTYYCYAGGTIRRYGTGYTYSADPGNYSGTASVASDIAAAFSFTQTEGQASESKQGYSALVSHTVAEQEKYKVLFASNQNASWSDTTAIENVPYGTAITSRIANGSAKGTGSVTVNGVTRSCSSADGGSYLQPNAKYSLYINGVPSSGTVTGNVTVTCGATGTNARRYGSKFTVTMAYQYKALTSYAVYSVSRTAASGRGELKLAARFNVNLENSICAPTDPYWWATNKNSSSDSYMLSAEGATRYSYLMYNLWLYPSDGSSATKEWQLTTGTGTGYWDYIASDSASVPAGSTSQIKTYSVTLYSNSETTLS